MPVATAKRQLATRLRPMLSAAVLAHQTDERLLALAAQGHEQAFATIFERYQRELHAHAARIVRAESCDDVVQHAMLAAWCALAPDVEIADARAWLHRITHNAALDAISRRGYADQALPDSVTGPQAPHGEVETRQLLRQALAAIAQLPLAQRQALTLTAFDGHSGRDGAAAMGVSESAFRQLVHRARSHLRSSVSAVTPMPLLVWASAQGASVGTVAAGAQAGASVMVAKVAVTVALAGAGVAATAHVSHVARDEHAPRTAQRAPSRSATAAPTSVAKPIAAAAAAAPRGNRLAPAGRVRSPHRLSSPATRAGDGGARGDSGARIGDRRGHDGSPAPAAAREDDAGKRPDGDRGGAAEPLDDAPVSGGEQLAQPASAGSDTVAPDETSDGGRGASAQTSGDLGETSGHSGDDHLVSLEP